MADVIGVVIVAIVVVAVVAPVVVAVIAAVAAVVIAVVAVIIAVAAAAVVLPVRTDAVRCPQQRILPPRRRWKALAQKDVGTPANRPKKKEK